MSKGVKKFNEIMYTVDNDDDKVDNRLDTITPIDYLNRSCSKLKLKQDLLQYKKELTRSCTLDRYSFYVVFVDYVRIYGYYVL